MNVNKVLFLLCGFLFSQAVIAKNYITASYENANYKEVPDATIIKLESKYFPNNFFEAIYGDIQYKKWDTLNADLDTSGVSGQLVGFYDVDSDGDIFGSTQLQLASSNLFPKSTVYQELSYRAGEKKNILLGLGLGYQDYYDNDADIFFKVGPVYYFNKGAIGYKYGKYNDSKSTLNSLFLDYYVNDNWSVNAVYNFGEGYWDTVKPYGSVFADMNYDELKLTADYKVNQDFSIKAGLGKSKMINKDTNEDFLNSNNVNFGVSYFW